MRGILHGEDFSWSAAPRFGGGGGTTSTNTVQNTTPWSGQQPYLLQTFQQADNLYNSRANWPQYYPGNTYQQMDPRAATAANTMYNFGINGGSPALTSAQNNANYFLSGNYTGQTQPAFNQTQGVLSNELSSDYLNPWNSPSFQTVVNNTMASVLPSITSSFIGGNRSNSGLAASAASQGLANAVGNLAQNQFNTNQQIQQNAANLASNNALTQQDNQIKALALAPTLDQQTLTDLNSAYSAGSAFQQDAQNQLNANVNNWNYNQSLPFSMLSYLQNAIGGNYGGNTTGSLTQPYYSNTGANALSGALGGAALGAAALPSLIGVGAGGGAGIGAIGGLMIAL